MMRPNVTETTLQIMDALDEAATQMESEARVIRRTLAHDGFTGAEVQIMRQLLQDKRAFYAQCQLIGVVLEQLLDDATPHAVTTRHLFEGITALQKADSDLTRTYAVARRIEKALGIVVKLAARFDIALP